VSGERCELASGVWGGAPTAQRLSTIFSTQDDLSWHALEQGPFISNTGPPECLSGVDIAAICRSPISETWYLFDDHLVTEVPAKTVVTKDAYLLFYQRRCERNSAAAAHLRSAVLSRGTVAPSGDSVSTSLADSSIENNTVCGMQRPFVICDVWQDVNAF